MSADMFWAFNRVLRAPIGSFCAKREYPELGAAFAAMGDSTAYPVARVFSGDLAADVRFEGLAPSTRDHHAEGLTLLAQWPDAARDRDLREAFGFYALAAFTGGSDDLGEELQFLADHWPSFVRLVERDICASDALEVLGAAWDVITGLSIITDEMVPCCGTCEGCLRH